MNTLTSRTAFKLLPNIQFIYELHLAEREAIALAGQAELGEDFRTLWSNDANGETCQRVLRRSAYVGSVSTEGETAMPSDYALLTQNNVTRAFNQYITHWFYPYKGKYHPQMVRALANIIGLEKGQTLLDPFVGSGTSAVEGALLGLHTIGFDVSPLCVLIGKVKANAVHHLERIEQVQRQGDLPASLTRELIENLEGTLSDPAASFELLARMIAKSDEARRGQDYETKLTLNREKMLRSLHLMRSGCERIALKPEPAQLKQADARALPLADGSVDGVITSPPYSIALNYVENDAHALQNLGYDLERIREEFIGVRGSGQRRFDLYEADMHAAYGEIARVLKPGRKAAIVLGNVTFQGQEMDTVSNCIEHFRAHGMTLTQRIDKLIYGLYNVMQREWILIFEKLTT